LVSLDNTDRRDLKKHLPLLSTSAGVYLFLDEKQQVLYVGKARNLKKRVSSYFRKQQSSRLHLLMQQVTSLETTTTETENQALLLESNLIKQLKPRYNILLRDDKSYPYIILSNHQSYPRLGFYRGPRLKNYRYFGPFPSTTAVRETLNLLQKLFKIRSCQDSFFRNRSRPCLQYQIKRCTAPCVSLITAEDYKKDVERTVLFLAGKSQAIIADLVQQMEEVAQQFDYESAARLRDQIAALREIQQKQIISTRYGDLDIFACAHQAQLYVIYVMSVRGGRLLGGKAYFPSVPTLLFASEVLSAFLEQFYLQAEQQHTIPNEIVVANKLQDQAWLLQVLAEHAQHKIKLITQATGERQQWLKLATQNAKHILQTHLLSKHTFYKQLQALQSALQLENLPQRLECFDVSHSQGEATVAACVVFDTQGPRKMDYRRFNIAGIIPGDDYAALRQALQRRYRNLKAHEENLPDILLIDGGKGQLKQAQHVLEELQISGILMIAIAKGPTRKPGLETLFLSKAETPLTFPADSPALHALQQLRDEAHRFAITGHRGQRAKKRRTSTLENIPGVGKRRRRELLRQFGGLHALQAASAEDIAKVPGISKTLAQRIYFALKS
jgi:excinuclease ABC subunit C